MDRQSFLDENRKSFLDEMVDAQEERMRAGESTCPVCHWSPAAKGTNQYIVHLLLHILRGEKPGWGA